ncbi:MAG: DoxX family protein [Blastocatellia bacterium]
MNKFFGEFVGGRGALGLLIVRVIFGLGLMQHGWSKIQKPFSWMGPESTVPGFLQALAALSEFGGGIALILGLLTPIAMFGLMCTMLTAIFMVHVKAGDPFVARGGGRSYELAALYLGFAVMMILTGPGKLSIDARLFGRRYEWIDRR